MLEVLLRLVDRFVSLAERREKQRGEFFRNFIEPLWKDFDAVHQNYLDSFRRYLELSASAELAFDHQHPLFRVVEIDSMLLDSLREKIGSAFETLGRAPSGEVEMTLQELQEACLLYLLAGAEVTSVYTTPSFRTVNGIRMELNSALRAVVNDPAPNELNRRVAELRIKECIARLQNRYAAALHKFHNARAQLLLPTGAP